MQRAWRHVSRLARAALHDLFAEEAPRYGDPSLEDPLAAALAGLQARLDGQQHVAAEELAHAKQAELAWRAAAAEAERCAALADAALLAGDAAGARQALERARPWQTEAVALRKVMEAAHGQAAASQADLAALRQKLLALRRQWAQLAEQERHVRALEAAGRLRHELTRGADRLADQLDERAEQAARRADRQTARRELARESEVENDHTDD